MLTAGAACAHAEDAVPQMTVKYSDLNLTSDVGIHTLYSRIKAAAAKVCDGYQTDGNDANDLSARTAFKACRDTAINQAVAQMNIAPLTQLASGSNTITLAAH